MKSVFLPIATLLLGSASAQLVIQDAVFFIGEGAVVTVQGNLQTNVAIQAGGSGATQGKIQMKGAGAQTITASGPNAAIPFLEIDNVNNVSLLGTNDLTILDRMLFTNGKLQLGAKNLIINDDIVFDGTLGSGNSRFLETNGDGEVRQLVPALVAAPGKVIPVGTGSNYTPATYTVAGATFAAGSYIGVRASGTAVPTPQRHPRTETFLGTAWNVSRSGINGGTVNVVGKYTDGQITGNPVATEADLRGMFWNGSNWSTEGGTQNVADNTIAANVPTTGGLVYGMNRFVLVNSKVFLQGAYNSGTGLMSESYRTPTLIIPSSDPYRSAPISGSFTHVQNNNAETVNASVFNEQANGNHNIVDWVFVQLRSITNATTAPVIQTRSALLRRNGDIVDVDNLSPLYFKNVDGGNYAISIRHRNHLGISSNPAVPIGLGLTPTSFDFTNTAAGNVMGTAGTNFLFSSVRQMYSGDVNTNTTVNYIGLGATDRAALLLTMANASNAPSPQRSINNSADYLLYSRGDLNFDKIVNYIGLGATDRSNLLSSVLGGTANASKTQLLPNN